MPIRMTDDDPNESNDSDDSGDSGGGGGGGGGGSGGDSGGGGAALLACLAFGFRHPVLSLLLLLVIGAVAVFGEDGASSPSSPAEGGGNRPGRLGYGATLDRKVYDEVLVHEPLSAPPPSRVPASTCAHRACR